MEGLFYSKSEHILFYIPTYYTNGTGMLKILYNNLNSSENILMRFQPHSDIYASEIYTSRRHKGMWCFHTSLEECPVEAFELGEGWTMQKWIEN